MATTDPLNRTTTLTYDAAGNVATSTDALNRITSFQYDVKNRLTQVTDPNTGVTAYAYDGNGNLLTVTDAKNQVTTFAYDSRNRLLSTPIPWARARPRRMTAPILDASIHNAVAGSTTAGSYEMQGRSAPDEIWIGFCVWEAYRSAVRVRVPVLPPREMPYGLCQ